jgi:hypothetical protein
MNHRPDHDIAVALLDHAAAHPSEAAEARDESSTFSELACIRGATAETTG